jgi:methionine-rich copper-binding protein CopC
MVRRALTGLGVVLISFFIVAPPASANSLVSSIPSAGVTVTASPGALTLTTASPVMDIGNSVSVTDPQGTRVDDGTITVNGNDVIAGLSLLKTDGPYTVSYTLLTDNDVPLQGSFTFSYKAPSVISSASPTPSLTQTTPPETVNGGGGVPMLIAVLLIAAVLVFLGLCYYAWNIIKKR